MSCNRTILYCVRLWGRGGPLLLLLALGCGAGQPPAPGQPGSIGEASIRDLTQDAVPVLRQFPHVARVTRSGRSSRPTHRIIHLADWHFVEQADYAADLRSLSDDSLSEEEVDRAHAELLADVVQIQHQQLAFLRHLIRHHGLKRIHMEALTEQDRLLFNAKVSALQNVAGTIRKLRDERTRLLPSGQSDPEVRRIIRDIEQVVDEYERDMLQIGAAGKLLYHSEIDDVLPLEDAAAYAAANPVAKDGTVSFDQHAIEARQDAQVRLLLKGEPFSLIVLGGAHDLSDNVKRLSDGTAEYIRVELEAWQELVGDDRPTGE